MVNRIKNKQRLVIDERRGGVRSFESKSNDYVKGYAQALRDLGLKSARVIKRQAPRFNNMLVYKIIQKR